MRHVLRFRRQPGAKPPQIKHNDRSAVIITCISRADKREKQIFREKQPAPGICRIRTNRSGIVCLGEVIPAMLSATFMLLVSSALLMLRLGDNASSFPRPLKPQEEQEYIQRAMEGDLEARNILIEHNLRLVMHIIKKYYTSSADAEDLVSIGTIGLIKGVSTYRPDKGVRLATYASKCIENEILMHFRGQKKSAGDVSLSEALDTDGEGEGLALLDTISTDPDILEELSRKEAVEQVRRAVEAALEGREAQVIRLRYGLDGRPPMPQREVAAIIGISRSYVSRIEKKALERLRKHLEA